MFKTMRESSKLLAGFAMLLMVFGLTACDDDDDNGSIGAMVPQAQVRVIHLSPDAPLVDVYVNGVTKAVSGLDFAESTGFVPLDAGSYDFAVTAENDPVADSVLDIAGLPLAAGKSYTAVAFDELDNIQPLALEDDLSTVAANTIRVRAIHTAVGVGQVDIWNVPAVGAASVLYADVDFGGAGDYKELPAAAYSLGFDTDNDADPDLIFDLPALGAGTIANVFAVQKDGAVFLLAQFADGSIARIDPRS